MARNSEALIKMIRSQPWVGYGSVNRLAPLPKNLFLVLSTMLMPYSYSYREDHQSPLFSRLAVSDSVEAEARRCSAIVNYRLQLPTSGLLYCVPHVPIQPSQTPASANRDVTNFELFSSRDVHIRTPKFDPMPRYIIQPSTLFPFAPLNYVSRLPIVRYLLTLINPKLF